MKLGFLVALILTIVGFGAQGAPGAGRAGAGELAADGLIAGHGMGWLPGGLLMGPAGAGREGAGGSAAFGELRLAGRAGAGELGFVDRAGESWQGPVTGVVRSSEDGKPLAGVNVLVKGKKAGTQTNESGVFSIAAAQGDVLVFSFTGFTSQEVKVSGEGPIELTLKQADAGKLGEVVVVGYGKQSRRTLSGSVSTVDQSSLKSSPSTNLGTALQGTVTGIRVQQTTGQPGATPTISFRGGTNFDGTGSPLIILDGIIVSSLYGINMEDVESVDVLKDAGSTAIYGARASNGVILITTKKGKKGRTQVSYSFRQTYNFARHNPLHYLSAAQYIHWNRSGLESRWEADTKDGNVNAAATDKGQLTGAWGWALSNSNGAANGLYSTQLVSNANRNLLTNPQWHLLVDQNPFVAGQTDSILYRSTDERTLENMILQRSNTQEHYLNFSGANDQGSFALGLGTAADNGILIGSSLRRMSLNFNGGLNAGKRLKLNLNLSGYADNTHLPYADPTSYNSAQGGIFQRFVGVAPTVRFTNDTSGAILPGPNAGDTISLGNPKYWSQIFNRSSNQQRIAGSLGLEYTLTPWLKFLASGSGYLLFYNYNLFVKAYQPSSISPLNTSRVSTYNNYNDMQYSYNAFLQFDKTFGDHTLSILGGGEFFDFREHTFNGSAGGAPTDYISWLSAAASASVVNGAILNPQSAYSDFNIWYRFTSGIARVNYSYKNKYFVTANARYDGTSMLTKNTYGLFPGISAGWNMNNEDFFQNGKISKYISTLKPRVSYGVNGSIDPLTRSGQGFLPYYPTTQIYSYAGLYNGLAGSYIPNYVNQNLKWEKAATLNFGADLGLFQNRIVLLGDYFIRNVYNKIAQLPISAQTGFTTFTTNLGELRNKGVELELKAKIVKAKRAGGLSVDFGANYYTVKSYVIKLPYNGLSGNRQQTIQVWDPAHPGVLKQVEGLQEGHRVGLDEVWAPSYDGIYTSQAQLDKDANVYNSYLPYTHKNNRLMGDARWTQVYQNDTIDSRQFVYVGRTTPDILGGFSTNIAYRGFTLYAQFDYALNFVILNNEKLRGLSQVQGSQNSTVDVLKTWSPTNPNGTLPRFYWANQGRNYATDASGNNPFKQFWERGDYLALRELTLSYELGEDILRGYLSGKIRSVRLYVTGSNLAYFTKYDGNFPEVGGIDNGKYPLPRRLTLGATVNF